MEGRKAAGDGPASRSVKAFRFGNIGRTQKRNYFGKA